ncbi:MAG: leucine-rich repeat protein [Bacteroidales bacterium]|nr:leucine-rich repeat protein [Bacteroidales bacterium]
MTKKRIRFLVIPLLIVCIILSAFTFGCLTVRLETPANLDFNTVDFVLTWDKVDNARCYQVKVESTDGKINRVYGEDFNIREESLSLIDELTEVNEYKISVRAVAYSQSKDYADSRWSDSLHVSLKATDFDNSGCIYTAISNGTEYEVTGWSRPEGGTYDVVIPATYIGKPIVGIADSAFMSKRVTSITVEGDNLVYVGKNAFYSCSYLESVSLPDSVTSIGTGAFHSCKLMTEFTMPAGVTEIESSTFLYCRSLESFDFGNVTVIGDSAFYGCNQALKSVSIPDRVTSIGDKAFALCELLTDVEIGSGCETVGEYAFQNDRALKTVEFRTDENGESALTEIGAYAFTTCSSIESLTLPQGVETIDDYAFNGASSLEKINIPETVTKIGSYAFTGTKIVTDQCDKMLVYVGENLPSDADKDENRLWIVGVNEDNVIIPSGMDELDIGTGDFEENTIGIADRAFYAVTAFGTAQITFPENIQYIGYRSFYKSSFTNVMFTGSTYSVAALQKPVYIDSYAFAQMSSLNNVQFNDATAGGTGTYPAVKSIGDRAFYKSPNVSDGFRLSASLEHVGKEAFMGTKIVQESDTNYGIKYIGTASGSTARWIVGYAFDELDDEAATVTEVLFDGVDRTVTRGIADYAFQASILIGEVQGLEDVTYIGEAAFYQCESLETVRLSDSVKELPDYLFYGCRSLSSIGTSDSTFDSLESVGRSAFYNCTSLMQIPLNYSSLDYIGKYAFYGCSELRTIPLNDKLREIDDYAFYKSGLSEIELPSSIERIGDKAFYKCTDLEEVVFDDSDEAKLEIGNYAFYKCESLESVTLSGNVKSVGNYAFYKCDSLSSLTMKYGVETIGEGAFSYAPITYLGIPGSVKEIGKYAFRGCAELKSVTIPSTVETIGDYAFYGISGATIYTDAESIKPYWSSRFNASNRPMVWGCELSEDETPYVVSVKIISDVTLTDVVRLDGSGYTRLCTAPERDGYEFLGWATSPGGTVVYSAENIDEAPAGTVLYSVWKEVEPPAEEGVDEEESAEGTAKGTIAVYMTIRP